MMNRTASSTLIAALALLVLLGVALAAGCASTPSTTKPTTAPTAAGTAAAGTATTAGTSGAGSGSAASAVGFAKIIPFLPTAAGAWALDGEPQGMTMKDADGRDYTWVSAEYVKSGDDKSAANIVIQDTAGANTPYKQQWASFRSIETTDGWWRSVAVKGQPGWKYHEKSSNGYGQWILVGDRYIVYANVDDGTEADLDTLVNAMDLAGLAAVK